MPPYPQSENAGGGGGYVASPAVTPHEKYPLRHNGGYTLVELIVAAVILAVAFAAVFATIRFVTHEQLVDYQRRQARMVINRIFEGAFSSYKENGMYEIPYALISSSDNSNQRLFVNIDTASAKNGTLVPFNASGLPKVCLDCRDGHAPIETDAISVEAGLFKVKVSAFDMNTHIVQIKLNWTPTGGESESLTLTKRMVPRSW